MNADSAMTPIHPEHPIMLAWERYKQTGEYRNTRYFATDVEHVDGSLWAAFFAGWDAHGGVQSHCEYADGLLAIVRELQGQVSFELQRNVEMRLHRLQGKKGRSWSEHCV